MTDGLMVFAIVWGSFSGWLVWHHYRKATWKTIFIAMSISLVGTEIATFLDYYWS